MGVRVVTGSRYLDGFISDLVEEKSWLDEKVKEWKELARVLFGVVHIHLHIAYPGMQNSIQQEWDFIQHVTPGIGEDFLPFEGAL